MRLFLILLLATSCGKGNKPKPTENALAEVQAKRDLYVELAKKEVDAYGWLSPKCDGLLFNSLAAYSRFPVNPLIAEKEPGLWHRHPENCYPDGSKSSISRDMFRGLFIYLLATKDVEAMKRIRDYGEKNAWIMGEGVISRTYFNPLIRNQLDRMIDASVPKMVAVEEDGYEDHLAVLSIFTEYLISGKVDDWELRTLKNYAEKSPRNALYQALYHKFTDGDQSKAIEIILDETLFPNRLPTENDHFTHYLWQRDEDLDWLPCGGENRPCEGLTHAGVDLMFVVKLLEE